MDLVQERIERLLADAHVPWGRPLVVVAETGSTNDDAKQAARDGAPDGAAFIADAQTGGRGRLGRVWFSPRGENLYASFVIRPHLDARRASLITLAAGLAVADAVGDGIDPKRITVKWPNDVYIDGRKVAGILSEAQIIEARVAWIVVGIGVNVHTRIFPPEIAGRATSLALAGHTETDRGALFVRLAARLAARIQMLESGGTRAMLAELADRDELAGRSITIDGAPATAVGIGEDGALRVRLPNGREESCLAGDVQLAGNPPSV